ncbi:MAG: CDP-glycerol glycerophosphotransferase family protein [Candidatus ainarchaeum sp.]|nr:CDP-glycerol glycerophosphotransferase family protein [Candidatus ainarchaeum sp.]MDD3975602.1 CDP-glycerol glycerophosphotransferase family protein [Candidatus ainarchaeum sp.]
MIFKSLFFRLVSLLDYITPKYKNNFIFVSNNGDFSNVDAFYKFMKSKKNFNLIWISHDNKESNYLFNKYNVKSYNLYSLKGFFKILFSKFIFVSHGGFTGFRSKRRVVFHLWHGCALKNMGRFLNQNTAFKYGVNKNCYFIFCSQIDKLEFSSAYNIDPNKILLFGLARNDVLFNSNFQKKNLTKLLLYKCKNSNYKKIYFYLPTFRDNFSIYSNSNVNMNYLSNLFLFKDFNLKKFNLYLKKNNFLLLVKLHPYDLRLKKLDKFDSLSNILFILNSDLNFLNFNLYSFMGASDVLITDYSSVAIDYLLLNKPIFILNSDLNKFKYNRGLFLDPIDFWLPGKIINNYKSLLFNFDKYDSMDSSKIRLMLDLRHKYKDGFASKRLYYFIKENYL